MDFHHFPVDYKVIFILPVLWSLVNCLNNSFKSFYQNMGGNSGNNARNCARKEKNWEVTPDSAR